MKPSQCIAGFFLLFLFLSANVAADGQAWKFRSDLANSGVYDDGGTRPDGTLLWTFNTGDWVRSSPAVADGVVYVGSRDDNVYALDTVTGDLLWNYTTGGAVESSPAVVDGVVYVGSVDNDIYAIDAGSGNLLWNYTTGRWIESSPAVVDGVVYVGSWDNNLYALDAGSGDLLWNYTAGQWIESSPAVVDGVVYVGSYDDNVYALDAGSGDLLWNYTTGYYISSSPAVVDGVVYVGSWDNNLYALDAGSGDLLWNYTTGYPVLSSPAVADGIVYVGSYDDNVYAIDTETGALLWNYTTGDPVQSSPAVADGIVYVGSWDSYLYALDAYTGDLLWKYMTGYQVQSSPAVIDGVVYVGSSDGNVYAIGATPGPAFDDFDDNTCDSTIWDIIEYGGPSVDETGQRVEITVPADSSAERFFAGYSSICALRGDFDIQVDYELLTWPPDSGVRAGLWIEDTGTSCTVERVSYSSLDYFAPGDHYTTNFADSILVSATDDTNGKLRLVRTGTAINGYYFDEDSHDWVLLQSVPDSAISESDVTFKILAWGHDYSFGDELVKVAFDNVVINTGEVIYPAPVADFSADVTAGDAPLDVVFTDNSTGVVTTRFWDFGDGTTAWANGTLSVPHTYSFPGSFTVSLTAANADGQDTVTKTDYIQVSPSGLPPYAYFTASPRMGASPLEVQFTDHSLRSPAGWYWDFGDGTTSTDQSPTHTYTTAGTYSAILTVGNSGGNSTYASSVLVRTGSITPTTTPTAPVPGYRPIALFSASKNIGPAPLTIQFTDRSMHNPDTWQWDFGDGSTSSEQNPGHTYAVAGRYTPKLTVSNSGGSSSYSSFVWVTGSPVTPTTTPTTIPTTTIPTTIPTTTIPTTIPTTVPTTGVPQLPHLFFGDVAIGGVPAPSGSAITAVVTGGGGFLITETEGAYGNPSFPGKKLIVQGSVPESAPIEFYVNGERAECRDAGAGGAWQTTWPFESGEATELDLRVPVPTTIPTTVPTTTIPTTIPTTVPTPTPTPRSFPVASFSMNTSHGSAPLTVNFTDSSFRDPATWSWDFGDGAGSILQDPIHTFQDRGTYRVTLTVSNMKGSNSAFKNVFVW